MSQPNNFSFVILSGPERKMDLFNTWSSLLDIESFFNDALVFFNPFSSKDHDAFLDDASFRNCQIFKFNRFQPVSRCWNMGLLHSLNRYVIICNDDLIFQDNDPLPKVLAKHNEGYPVVHLTENWSCFSIDKKFINQIGWFDENFMHSWEDVDFRYRMERMGAKDFRFNPFLVYHTRSQAGRSQSYWDQSSEYFFKKWAIDERAGQNFDDPGKRRQFQTTGFFRNVDSTTLNPNFETPNFYPQRELTYDTSI